MGSTYSKQTLEKSIYDLELEDSLETAAEQWQAVRTLSSVVEDWFSAAGGLV